MKTTSFALILLGLVSCTKTAEYNPERNFSNNQKSILTSFILAQDSSVIELPAGHFQFDKSLILEGKSNVTIKGQGKDKTILSFKNQTQGAEGIRVANCKNITLRGFGIEDAAGDNIKVTDTDHILFEELMVGWTGKVDSTNGAYGLYPVICSNVTVRNCIVMGASDAGIYVGQSDTVLIEGNTTYWNVAGIESENSKEVIVRNNISYDNTGGILVFDLPGLTQYGNNIEVYGNNVYENNRENFAPLGNMVSVTPPGTGILILATKGVKIHNNTIRNNKTIAVGMVSYALLEAMGGDQNTGGGGSREELEKQNQLDVNYDPYVGNIHVYDNTYENTYLLPNLNNDFGKLFLLKFGASLPQVAWDGLQSPNYYLADGSINPSYVICVNEAEEVKTVNLDASNEFAGLEENPAIFNCN
ncbi:right-handed parallel beta-helix repeat-containing protein [Reichenbachiella carrageenanivorans]|uniref:Right-handed parallel beta-helix repeat-containing protein n=1 Tax=Reichenbachiella carrageenanivorans TaxID=2979869 RepID=A0ABY6CYD8_9BACT|nr:parallel beta-helix domain-containing protein [Reichenbachiella carrageenanivorans]UXX78927.1 right-handed parallel beta-helix repeat-containing protein [Reichenbachiella carrageenanivorans]